MITGDGNSIKIEMNTKLKLFCSVCRGELRCETQDDFYSREKLLLIDPCEKCLPKLSEFNDIFERFANLKG